MPWPSFASRSKLLTDPENEPLTLQNLPDPVSRATALFIVLMVTLVALTPSPLAAQTGPGRPPVNDPTADTRYTPREPFIDRKVTSVIERFSAWKARMKKQHFTAYLLGYTCFWSGLFGSLYGFLAFRFGDAMALYRRIRKKTLLLSIAVGSGLGVLVAVSQIPPTSPGKVTLLLMVVAVAALVTCTATMTIFVFQRRLLVAKTKRAGLPVSGRLRAP